MKIAIISDIHGNLDALSAVLADLEKEKCRKIFCLGDLVMAGPEPHETLNKIHDLINTKDINIIQGNTDNMLSVFSLETYNKILKVNDVMANAYMADSELLTDEEKEFLKNFPPQKEITIGNIKILLVHGSPRRNDENIFPNLKIEEVEEMIKGTDANIIFCGHTHMPCGYQTNTEQTVVNVGSVGRPFTETPDSCYVVMDIDEEKSTYTLEHRFVKYNVEHACEKIIERKFKGAEKLAKMLKKATSRYPE